MAGDEVLPWNVSRCNRLLRPLSSKLAKLRKALELPRTAHQEPRTTSSAFATKATPQKTTNFTRPAHKPRSFDKARDPDWRPGANKGARKTYGGRKAKRLAAPMTCNVGADRGARPGEIAFTPLIARMGGRMLDSPLTPDSPLRRHTKNRGPLVATLDRAERFGPQVPADVKKLVVGMLEAYANILHATHEKRSRKGTGSLMSACLKKLPAYIELEEHFAQIDHLEHEDESDGQDVATEIYEDLETRFEQRRGQGWRPFKYVVRAHATSLLCSAIEDEILGLESLGYFHSHCLAVGAYDEAEEMLVAALPLLEPLSIPLNVQADLFGDNQVYLSTAKSFVDRTGRHRFLYDLLEHMVAHELLPLEWLATIRMRPIWDRLVRTITEGDQRTLPACSRFLETCMLTGMGLPDERLLADKVTGATARRFVPSSREGLRQALNTTFLSLLTVLCSIALVNGRREDGAGEIIARRVTHTLDAITIALTTRSDVETELRLLDADSDDLQIFGQRACWTVFCSFLVHLDACDASSGLIDPSTSTLIHQMSSVMRQYSANGVNSSTVLATLPLLISAIARGTGRIWHDSGFVEFQRLIQAMTGLTGHRLPHKLWTLKRIALESATEFANDTDEREHLKYANEVERQMRTSGRLVIMLTPRKTDTPSSAASGGGFRWEDGIGEWVACTPFPKAHARPNQRPIRALTLLPTPAQSSASDSDDEEDCVQDSDHDSASSPTKRPHSTALRKRKRTRASSPVVLIRAKPSHITPPLSPVAFYPHLPKETSVEGERQGERRLRRSTTQIKRLRLTLGARRSSGGARGLRDVPRVRYDGASDGLGESEDELSFGF
ncbi:uncharacterized protein M421DRAFT_104048 [Didymella exigua CBS 183.55]|uniref:Uncharacterized protein n=1 Tax=Didymella exigua CBS 183.55 TaxID=1150837 RepID=A0A6A5R9R1_9PLEO|nr:uncharacterized protein M421DRAFT_104048 [Didymella exigua CBS 183.55]KAF1924000.1 hypothetical protein M421DRAFT_104048 [Didymella exigua CBS 183.55]